MYALISQEKIDHMHDRSDLCITGQHKLGCVQIDFRINHFVILRKLLELHILQQTYRSYQYIFSSPEHTVKQSTGGV